MRIAVTGASGNVGTALLRRLSTDGGHSITAISRRVPSGTFPYGTATWRAIDIGDPQSRGELADAFRDADAVVHLAWAITPSHDREAMRATNQGGTKAVLVAAQQARVPHLVHMSSVGTYAAARGQWKDETWAATGIGTSAYSVDKAACEALLHEAADLVVTRVRPALILQPDAASEISRYFLGPLVPLPLLRPALLRRAPLPREIAVQFVHTDDVADALVRILERTAGGAFNLAAEPVLTPATWTAMFGGVGPPLPPRLLRQLAELSWRARLQPTSAGWVDLGFSVPLMTTQKARSELDWYPRHSVSDLLPQFLDALRRRRGGSGPLLYPRGAKTVA